MSASGVLFITLEDETGVVNLVVYQRIDERYQLAARHAGLLLARGRVDRRGDVVHVQVRYLERLEGPLDEGATMGESLRLRSRDFH